MKTIEQLCREALVIQDACNPIALSRRYGEVLIELREAIGNGDSEVMRCHPVNRLWVSKLHDLAGMGLSELTNFSLAYDWCQARLNPEEISK